VRFLKYLLDGFGNELPPFGSLDARSQEFLKLAQGFLPGLGFRLRRGRQHPFQYIILDALVT
jgi:hypothetical protein